VITLEDFDKHGSFRARRFGPDFPAFKGRDMIPKGTLTELAAKGLLKPPQRRRGGKDTKGGKKQLPLRPKKFVKTTEGIQALPPCGGRA